MATRRLVTWITFLSIFAMAARISVDTDTWWHLRVGQWIVEHHQIMQVDPFSYTRYGQQWEYPKLVEVPMYWIYSAFGPGGLNIWTAVMVVLAFGFIWKVLQGGVFLRAFTIILSVTVSSVYWAARPYLVTFVLAAVFIWILEMFRWRADPKSTHRLWWLPFLMVVWVNSHGGFIVGFLLWGVYIVGELIHWIYAWATIRFTLRPVGYAEARLKFFRLGLIGLLMVVAVCLNPSGPGMLLYPFKTVEISSLQNFIQEWQSPNFHDLNFQPFAWLLFILLGVVGASRRRLATTDFLLVSGFAFMGLLAGRNVALFALVAPIVITRHATPLLQNVSKIQPLRISSRVPAKKTRAILNYILLGALTLAVFARLALIYPLALNQEHFNETLPVQAVEEIKAIHPPGRLFNSYNFGGYLLWALPEYPVFIDGRTDLYNDEVIDQWLQVMRAENGWEDILKSWDVHLVLVEPNMPVAQMLSQTSWSELYRDDLTVVYAR